jgi:hypothetical protein
MAPGLRELIGLSSPVGGGSGKKGTNGELTDLEDIGGIEVPPCMIMVIHSILAPLRRGALFWGTQEKVPTEPGL